MKFLDSYYYNCGYYLPYMSNNCKREWLSDSLIDLFNDRSNRNEFTSLVRELARPGELSQNMSYDFDFVQVEKPYESYVGTNVRLQ